MEKDPFAFWNEQFPQTHQLKVAEGVIDLAKTLLPDIIRAPQTQRKEKSEEATRILEEAYPMDFLSGQLAIVAGRALIIGKLLWDEYIIESDSIDGPMYASGTLAGFRFVHHPTEQSNTPVPIFGLKLANSQILGVDEMPIAVFNRPLLIPVQEIQDTLTA